MVLREPASALRHEAERILRPGVPFVRCLTVVLQAPSACPEERLAGFMQLPKPASASGFPFSAPTETISRLIVAVGDHFTLQVKPGLTEPGTGVHLARLWLARQRGHLRLGRGSLLRGLPFAGTQYDTRTTAETRRIEGAIRLMVRKGKTLQAAALNPHLPPAWCEWPKPGKGLRAFIACQSIRFTIVRGTGQVFLTEAGRRVGIFAQHRIQDGFGIGIHLVQRHVVLHGNERCEIRCVLEAVEHRGGGGIHLVHGVQAEDLLDGPNQAGVVILSGSPLFTFRIGADGVRRGPITADMVPTGLRVVLNREDAGLLPKTACG